MQLHLAGRWRPQPLFSLHGRFSLLESLVDQIVARGGVLPSTHHADVKTAPFVSIDRVSWATDAALRWRMIIQMQTYVQRMTADLALGSMLLVGQGEQLEGWQQSSFITMLVVAECYKSTVVVYSPLSPAPIVVPPLTIKAREIADAPTGQRFALYHTTGSLFGSLEAIAPAPSMAGTPSPVAAAAPAGAALGWRGW